MIDRRAFLRRLGFGTVAAAATGVLDLEKLLWVPGEKTIFVPPPIAPLGELFQVGDTFTIAGVNCINPFTFQDTGEPRMFVITANVSAGNLLEARHVHPPLIERGPYKNITQSPARHGFIDGKSVTPIMWGDVLFDSRAAGAFTEKAGA